MFGNNCVKGMPAVCWILFLSGAAGFAEPARWPAKGFERIQEDCGTGSIEDYPLPADRPRAKELQTAAEKQGLTNVSSGCDGD